MSVATRSASMDRKRISISSKRQVTIPQKYFDKLGFGDEAECILSGNELIISPVRESASAEFSEQILADLLAQGLTGQELLERFKVEQRKVRPAVERMIAEADQMAETPYTGASLSDLFDTEA